jgi:rhodanese-related sulfurtransferase
VLGLLQNALLADPLPLTGTSTTAAATALTTTDQLRQDLATGAVLIDSRPSDQYAAGHIKGALSLPFEERQKLLEQFVETVPSSTRVIVYCDAGCDTAPRLASWLRGKGWSDAAVFQAGYSAWQDAGLPVATGEQP